MLGVEIMGAHELVMCRRMVFGVIISHIVGSGFPVYDELALKDSISDPIEAYIHCTGSAFLNGVVGDACRCWF